MRSVDDDLAERLDALPDAEAEAELRSCCASDTWVAEMLRRRPFGSRDSLLAACDAAFGELSDGDVEQAVAAHGRIGERPEGQEREAAWSRAEQADALTADEVLARRLAEGNREYEAKFGQVFLVRAAGRSAQQMYDALTQRLRNDPQTERAAVRRELAEITRLRLTRLVSR